MTILFTKVATMSDIKCPICGEILQKYGEVDPDTGTSIVLGANCPVCGVGDSDIKLWQELIRTRKALDVALDKLKRIQKIYTNAPFNTPINYAKVCTDMYDVATEQITALEQKEE